MRIFSLIIIILSIMFVFKCGDKGSSNNDPGKEIARIFFAGDVNIDTEEMIGEHNNRITCKQVSIGSGIIVNVKNYDGREFQLEIDNVTTTGTQFVTSYPQYKNADGEVFQATGAGLQSTEISWWGNLSMCEFKYKKNPVQLFSNSGHIILLDSLRIETLREDDL